MLWLNMAGKECHSKWSHWAEILLSQATKGIQEKIVNGYQEYTAWVLLRCLLPYSRLHENGRIAWA